METTLNYSSKKNNPSLIIFIGIFIFLIMTFFIVLSFSSKNHSKSIVIYPEDTLTAEQIRIIEVVSGHAWLNHGTGVNSAFDCLGKNGSTHSFKTFGFKNKDGSDIPTNLWLCFDGNDWYAIVTTFFEKVAGNKVARLVTSYKVSKDLFPQISDYINYIASKWGAVEIAYKINSGDIFLQPK